MTLHFKLAFATTVLLIYGILKKFAVNPTTQQVNVIGSMNLYLVTYLLHGQEPFFNI
jgi:hypothetical protein